jgi:3-oxoacyl-[acyl-carrier-protein] synthase II
MSTSVVVTGLGTTSPVGGDVDSTWAALLDGTSGVQVLTADWAEQLSTRIAATIAVDPADVLERVRARRLDPAGQFAVIAATEAWSDRTARAGCLRSRCPC